MWRLLSFSVFAASVAMAQTVGLPEYGILLTGPVLSPASPGWTSIAAWRKLAA